MSSALALTGLLTGNDRFLNELPNGEIGKNPGCRSSTEEVEDMMGIPRDAILGDPYTWLRPRMYACLPSALPAHQIDKLTRPIWPRDGA